MSEFRKKKTLEKFWLKATNYKAYKEYKIKLTAYYEATARYERDEALNKYQKKVATTIERIKSLPLEKPILNLIHSGNSGDIIYALPTIKKIVERCGRRVNLYLKLNQPNNLPSYYTHPLGNVMLNQDMANRLIPLLSYQSYINSCAIFEDQQIDIELDSFRKIPLFQGDIARWAGYTLGICPDLERKWLELPSDVSFSDKLIVARSERYRNSLVDYSFLQDYTSVYFVGVLKEYEDMRKMVPNIKWLKANNFFQLASYIAGCKFFIGNQSFPFSLAEGLKVPRALELSFDTTNVIPSGGERFDFYFQDHLKSILQTVLSM